LTLEFVHLNNDGVYGLFHTSHIKVEGRNIGIRVLDVMLVLVIFSDQGGNFLVAGESHLAIRKNLAAGSMQKNRLQVRGTTMGRAKREIKWARWKIRLLRRLCGSKEKKSYK
jgi:hypothetical protein